MGRQGAGVDALKNFFSPTPKHVAEKNPSPAASSGGVALDQTRSAAKQVDEDQNIRRPPLDGTPIEAPSEGPNGGTELIAGTKPREGAPHRAVDVVDAITRRRKRAAQRGEPVTIYFEKNLAERLRKAGARLGVGLAPIVQEAVMGILDEIERSESRGQGKER